MRRSKGLKLQYWLLLSFTLHLLAVFALQWRAMPDTPEDIGTIVDLTVLNPSLSTGKMGSPQITKSAPNKASSPSNTSSTPSVDSQNTSENTSENTAEDANAGALSGNGTGDSDAPIGFSEVTRLPKVKREVKALYPAEAKKAAIDGPVILEVLIDREGKVRHVIVISGPGHGLNESAIDALKQFEFQPAFKGEESVAVKIRYTYRFKLEVN